MRAIDLEETDYLLKTTKQVRFRLDLERPVPIKVVLECIDLASQAPIGGNIQHNRWMLVDDTETRSKIADVYRSHATPYLAERRKEAEAMGVSAKELRVVDSAAYLSENLHRVPMFVIPIRLGRPTTGEPVFDASSLWGSIYPGIWSFQLAARARGLGSALTTLHLKAEQEVAGILELPDTVTQAALLPLAYFTGETFAVTSRRPAVEVTSRNRWKQSPL